MDDRIVKSRLIEAMAEPPAPQELIRRTIVRADAICKGRLAEEELSARGSELPDAERKTLAAQSVIGRLMQTVAPPDGISADAMTRQLLAQPAFQQITSLPADRLLSDLRLGRVNRMLGLAGRAGEKNAAPAQTQPGPHRNGGPTL